MSVTGPDLWAAILESPRPHRVLDFPRNGKDGKPVGQVAIVVLTQEEQMACSAAAERLARKLLKDDQPKKDDARRGYDDLYNNAAAVEILFRACKRVNDPALPFFPTVESIRQHLTADEVGALMNHYFTVQTELGPIVAKMTDAEVDVWIERLGEGGSAFPLDLLSLEALRTLAFSLASRLHASTTSTSLPGTPPDAGEQSSDREPETSKLDAQS